MASEFKAGDVVRLKSGGPKMTVENAGNDMGGTAFVECSWFVKYEVKSQTFSPEALKLADDT